MASYVERELEHEVLLCDNKGNLNLDAVGWSRQPLHTCNLSGHHLRKKRWNYWCITSPDYLFSVTLSNVDYMGLPFIYFLDFKSNTFVEKTILSPFGKGCHLGEKVEDKAVYAGKGIQLIFENIDKQVVIKVQADDFGGKPLQAEFLVQIPNNHETLNVVIPWSSKNFQFTSKQNTLPTSGTVKWGGDTYYFNPDSAFACLDFGRGVWPFNCFWNWSSFSTRLADGRAIGVNLGAGWTDGTGMNENGLCIDGKLIKISEDVRFEYDTTNFMLPWRLRTTATEQVDLLFTPFYERLAKTDALLIKSEVHQMIGRFSGQLKLEKGEILQVDDAIGWAEDHHARW